MNRVVISPESDTYRLRQLGKEYFTSVECLAKFLNIPNNHKAAEVLFFIHNYNEIYRKAPSKSFIELHLCIKDISSVLYCLREYELVRLRDDKHYICTNTASFLKDIDTLNDYVVALHSLDTFYRNKLHFREFVTLLHVFETMPQLKTPSSKRRTLARCFCMCDDISANVLESRVSHATACSYAKDLITNYLRIEDILKEDSYSDYVKDTDEFNAIKYRQLSQLRRAHTYINNKKTKIDDETREIAEEALRLYKDDTNSINLYLYRKIVSERLAKLKVNRLSEACYWSAQPSLECIEI